MQPKYKRILLKLGGESLMDPKEKFGLNLPIIKNLAEEIREVQKLGVEIAIVLGGGNIFRGATQQEFGMDRSTGDYMGMLATVINSMALQNALETAGVFTRVQSAIWIQQVAEPYIKRKALRHLEKGRIVIFAAGTGNPFFSTDTAAALKANDIHAEILLKGTKVDGIYNADPKIDKKAKRYESLTYLDCLKENLRVMDATAISMCMENKLPILVFNMFEKGNFKKVVLGTPIGTLVHGKNHS